MPSSDANEVIGARVPLVRITERTPRLRSVKACVTRHNTCIRLQQLHTVRTADSALSAALEVTLRTCHFLITSRVVCVPDSGAEGPRFKSQPLRQTVHIHRACVHQAAKLVAALLMDAGVTAGLAESNGSLPPVYDSRHLQADCQEPGSAPEPYTR